jgi:protein-S-isoprenylcysteine O-methyltransferase Ste14
MGDLAAPASLLARPARIDLAVVRQWRAYDLVMRLPVLAYSLFLAFFCCVDLLRYGQEAGTTMSAGGYAINLAMRLLVIAYLVVLAAAVIVRVRPKRRAEGIEPRVSALLGTFVIPVVVLFPRRELPMTAEMVSTLLVLAGNAVAVCVLVQLGRSFSIMAEARRLVTSGVYRWVRHPLYLAEELVAIGVVLQFFSGWAALLLTVQIVFQLRRMRNEERVLAKSFPEYAAYRQTTAMLFPGIY